MAKPHGCRPPTRFSRRMLLFQSVLLLLTTTLASTTGCASTAFTVTDVLGGNVTFSGPVNSIVSLAPSNTEIVFAVGAGDKLIGRTDFCNYPTPEVNSIESVGGFSTLNKEAIVILNPDVVLAAHIHQQQGDTAWLEQKGLKVVTLEPQTLSEVLESISLVGKITGNEARAAELVADMQSRIETVRQGTSGLPDAQRPRVLHITWHDPLWTVGKDTFVGALIETAGGVNLFNDVSGHAQVNLEDAVAEDPDVITVFTSHGAAGDTSYQWATAEDSPFRSTQAYLKDRVHLVDADIASRGGPRIVDALELYARLLHPEIFPEP